MQANSLLSEPPENNSVSSYKELLTWGDQHSDYVYFICFSIYSPVLFMGMCLSNKNLI